MIVGVEIYFDEVETTVPRNESRDFLSVLDQLNSNAFTNGRVRLFSFDTARKEKSDVRVLRSTLSPSLNLHFFEDDAFGVRSTSEWVTLPTWAQVRFLVIFVVPALFTAMIFKFSRSTKTGWFTYLKSREKQDGQQLNQWRSNLRVDLPMMKR